MSEISLLHHFLVGSARSNPEATALRECTGKSISYRDLDLLSDRVHRYLVGIGVGRGDRVGMCLGKSIEAVAVIFGILKAGAAYVPVDTASPVARSAQIFADCSVKALILEERVSVGLNAAFVGLSLECPQLLLGSVGGGEFLDQALATKGFHSGDAATLDSPELEPDDLAYILYTSGSTGRPKGVMLSHRNATSFVHWCTEAFSPRQEDCFSSHAPLHFDLSILDLYVSIKHAATLILIDEVTGKSPGLLTELIARERISMWYSTPSVLNLLVQYGKMELHDLSSLRQVLYAGEVFPTKHLRAVKGRLPECEFFNLYGPTETNVCTYFQIPKDIPEDRTQPYPIGPACSHLRTKVVGFDGIEVARGQEGELCVSGPAVTSGYWNLPEQSAQSFLFDPAGGAWYKTGDVVTELPTGGYQFVGRRDRMIKRRGHRVELGEIEAALLRHPAVREAAAVVRDPSQLGVGGGGGGIVVAVLACDESARPSLIALKRFCSENLPASMIPDQFEFCSLLPKTSTDKIDYQKLANKDDPSVR